MKVSVLTHSSRAVDYERINLNFLTKRYDNPNRLERLPSLESLPAAKTFEVFHGAFTVYHVGQSSLRKLCSYRSDEKIQHVLLLNAFKLLICYESKIEVIELITKIYNCEGDLKPYISRRKEYNNNLFSGLHTVKMLDETHVLLSASVPDSALIFNLANETLENILRMPDDIYGKNYDIFKKDIDLKRNYISNDYQTTHVNSADINKQGLIVVSCLIQGAIGIFDKNGYREIVRGFVGCHGARFLSDSTVYFSDSTNGNLVLMSLDGKIVTRYCVNSRWLHDVHHVKDNLFLFVLSDKNEVQLIDIKKGRILWRECFVKCPHHRLEMLYTKFMGWMGSSTQFLSVSDLDEG